jgi:hypothetical protein
MPGEEAVQPEDGLFQAPSEMDGRMSISPIDEISEMVENRAARQQQQEGGEAAKEKEMLAGLIVKSVTQGALEKKVIETAEAQAAEALAQEDAEREAALKRARGAVEAVKKKMALPAYSGPRQQELLQKQLTDLQAKLDKLDKFQVEMSGVNVRKSLLQDALSTARFFSAKKWLYVVLIAFAHFCEQCLMPHALPAFAK